MRTTAAALVFGFCIMMIVPAASPAEDSGGHVVLISGKGGLHCFDAETGTIVWSNDTVKAFGDKIPGWGYNITPLLVGDTLVTAIRHGRLLAVYDIRAK